MTRAHRWWLGALAALLCLPPLAAALLLWWVDPDTLKPAIERQARDRFGIALQLRGPLRWSLWPALAVDSGEGAIALPGAEAATAPLSWRALRFTLQWPGWKNRDWQLQGVEVVGLRARVERDASGEWNVTRLLSPGAGSQTGGATAASVTVSIQPLRLRDGHIELLTEPDAAPWVIDGVQAEAGIVADQDLRHWSVQNLRLDARVAGPLRVSSQPLSVRTGRVDALTGDAGDRVTLAPLTLRWAGAEMQLTPRTPLSWQPVAGEGELQLRGDSLRDVLASHGVTLPPTRDAAALHRFAVDTHWRIAGSDVALSTLQLQLDDTTWRGSLSGHWRSPAAWQVDLEGDALNADRYRRPDDDPGEPFALPVAALRALPLTGTIRFRELRAAGATARDALITLQ